MTGLNILFKSFYKLIMESECSIVSDGFKINIQGLTLVAGNQFHIYDGSSDYGLYTIISVTGDTYTTSTRMPAFTGYYTINLIPGQ